MTRVPLVRLPLAIATLAACSSEPLRIALPDPKGGLSFVLLINGAELVGGSVAERLDLPELEVEWLQLAYFAEALGELGLAEGPISGANARCRDCRMLSPLAVFEKAGAEGEWVETRERWAELQAALVPDPWPRCSCDTLDAEMVPIPVPQNIRVVAALEEPSGTVLIGTTSNELVRLWPDSRAEVVCPLPLESNLRHAVMPEGGPLWAATASTIYSIDVSGRAEASSTGSGQACTVTSSVSILGLTAAPINWLSAGAGSVAAITSEYDVLHLEEGTVSKWASLPPLQTLSLQARVLWSSPELHLVVQGDDKVRWVSAGRAREETIRLGNTVELVADTAIFGRVAALTNGVAAWTSGGWDYQSLEGWTGASSIVDLGRGFLVMTDNGVYRQVGNDLTLCPRNTGFSEERVYRVAALGGSAAVLADIRTGQQAESVVGIVRVVSSCPREVSAR
ncbi:MAG: hypothetical protein HYV07_27785 [Deltaproteobacteria bacterium]|nr:hypothetical protein [Deltaproteobacteria bacterium]